jgi:amino acid transporter
MGFVTAGVAYTTGEITAFMPSTGGFVRHATKFVEPALGAATGWNFCKLLTSDGGRLQ